MSINDFIITYCYIGRFFYNSIITHYYGNITHYSLLLRI